MCEHAHQSKNRYNQLYYHHNLHNCCRKRQKNKVPEAKSNCLYSSSHLSPFISPFPCRFIHQTIIISLLLPSHPSQFLNHLSLLHPPSSLMIQSAFLASVCLFTFPNTVFTAYHLVEYLCHYVLLCLSSLFQCHTAGTQPTLLLLEGAQYTCTYWVSVARSIIFIRVRFWLEEGLKKRNKTCTEWGRWRDKMRRLICKMRIKRF